MDRHWHKTLLRKDWKPVLLSIVILQVVGISISPLATANAVSIVGPAISQSLSVTVPGGGTSYFYGATEGGAFDISATNFTPDLSVTNPAGFKSVVIGHSSSNTGNFISLAEFPIIGGIGATGTPTQTFTFFNSGFSSFSGGFTLAQNSFVVLVSASSNNNSPVTLSSPFVIDNQGTNLACNFGSGCGAVVFAHATMSAGPQSLTLTYSPVAPGFQNTPAEAIGVVAYVFPLASPVGGIIQPADMTSLFLAGITTNAFWMTPTFGVAGAALAFFKVRRKRS